MNCDNFEKMAKYKFCPHVEQSYIGPIRSRFSDSCSWVYIEESSDFITEREFLEQLSDY
jgi:hypothetical protein